MSLIRQNREENDPRNQVQINVPPPPPPTVPTGLEADPSLASQIPPEPTVQDVLTPAPPTLQDNIAAMAQGSSPEMLQGFGEQPDITQVDPSIIPQSTDLSTTPGQEEVTQADFSGAPTISQVEQLAKDRAQANFQAMQTAAYADPASAYIQGGMPRLFEGSTSADLFEWQQKFSNFVASSAEQARRNLVTESFQPQTNRNDPSKPNFNSMRNPITSGGVPGMVNNIVKKIGGMFQPSNEFNPWAGYQAWWNDVKEKPWKIVTAPFVPLIASTQGKYGEFGNGWWGQAMYVLSLPENIVKGGLTDLTNLVSGNQNPESNVPNIVQAVWGQNYDFSQEASSERPVGTVGSEKLPKTREELRGRSWLYRVPLSGLFEKTPLGVITGGDRLSDENIGKLPETVNIPFIGERPTVNVLRTSEFIGGLVLDAISGATDNVVRSAGRGLWGFLNPKTPNAPKLNPVNGVTQVPNVGEAEWKPINIQERYTKPTQLPNNTVMAGSSGRVDPTQVPIPNQQALTVYGAPAPRKLPELPQAAERGTFVSPEYNQKIEVIQGEFAEPPIEATINPNKLPSTPSRPALPEAGGQLATIPIQGELVEVPVGKPIVEGGSTNATTVIIDAQTVRPLLPEAAPQVIPSEVLTPPKPPSQIMRELQSMTPGQRVNPSALVHVPRSNEELTALARFMGDVPPTRGTPLNDLRIDHLGSLYPPGLNPYARYGYPIPIEKLNTPNPVVQVSENQVADLFKPPELRPYEDLNEFFESARKNSADGDILTYYAEKYKTTGNRDQAILDIYQNGTTYKPINAYLREGMDGIKKYVQRLEEQARAYDEPFDAAQATQHATNTLRLIPDVERVLRSQPVESGRFYRGIGDLDDAEYQAALNRYKVGEEVDELGFTAASTKPEVARAFTGKEGGNSVLFEIDGTAHKLLGETQDERLFPPGSKFKVESVNTEGNTTVVRMSQVSPTTIDKGIDDIMRVPDLSDPEELARVIEELPDDIKVTDPKLLQEWLDDESVARNLEVDVQELAPEVVESKRILAESLERVENLPNVGRRNALDAAPFQPSKPPVTETNLKLEDTPEIPDEAVKFADAVIEHERVGSQATNRAIFKITKGEISDDLQVKIRNVLDNETTNVREKLIELYAKEKFGIEIQEQRPFYHGSKVRNLDLNSIDPIVGSARHELGVGIYLTNNIKYAEDYALATPHRNLPPIEGRNFDEIGQVYSVTPNVKKTIIANDPAPKDVHEAFLKAVAESFDEEVVRAVRKTLGVKKQLKPFRDYYTTVDSIVAKVAGDMDFPESEVLQFQRIVADKLRVMGYDSILDNGSTDSVMVLLNPGLANAKPIKQMGSGSLIEQAAARYNAASTTAARVGGNNPVLNTIAEEAKVTLQTRITQQTMEQFENASKRAEDASMNLIEQERRLRRQARAEAPKRRAQAQRKYDAQNENQIRHDSAVDKNPCI